MKRSLLLVVALIFASVPVIGLAAPPAAATPTDDCRAALVNDAGVNYVAPNCVVSSTIAKTGNVILPAGTGLKIAGTGTINAVGGGINIKVNGDFTMDAPTVAGASRIYTAGGALTLDVAGNVDMAIGSLLDTGVAQNANGGAITITVAKNMTMHGNGASGAAITSSVAGGSSGDAGAITITVGNCDALPPTGDFVTEPGAKIQGNSAKGSGAAIDITGCHAIATDGLVESVSGRTGTGAKQGPGGGPVSLDAGCELAVSDTGIVRSKGLDPGADLVHLQGGCAVTIFGLVESTGVGHGVPNSPPNHCDSANRPDKPANSTACVEIWSGQGIVIDGTPPHNGQVNADTGGPGGSGGTSWIDIFARDDINIIGKTGAADPYSVHANGNATSNDNGGTVTVKSIAGQITTSGKAISANALGPGGDGGVVTVEAFSNVAFDGASIQARGATSGTGPVGGSISARSYHGGLTGAPPGELNAGATTVGAVKLQACSAPAYTGAVTGTLTTLTGPCVDAPTVNTSYVQLPECACQRLDVCPICDPDPTHNVVVDTTVTVNFNPVLTGGQPTCDDGVAHDLCLDAHYDTSGPTADTWKVIFDVGPRKLIIKDNVIVTTTTVPISGSNRVAPGIEIHGTCELVIEGDTDGNGQPGAVIVNSVNQQAGNIVIEFQGNISIDGWVRNVVTGTLGRPGSITIASCCGDIVTGTKSRIETIGVDPGGNDINIVTCCQRGYGGDGGDIWIQGLVMGINKGHPGTPVPNINVVSLVGSVTIDGTTDFGLEQEGGSLVRRTSGVLARTTNASNSGNINIQALLDVKVIGRNIIDKTKPQYGAVAIKPLNTSGQGGDGDMKVTSLTGNVIGIDRAFDFENRYNVLNAITINAALDINLSVTASIDNGALNNSKPVVNSRGGTGGKGGTNTLRSFSQKLLIGTGAQVLANAPGGVAGANAFTTCGGVVSTGTVDPVASLANACSPSAPDPLTWKGQPITDCAVFGITEDSFHD